MKKHSIKNISILFLSALCFSACHIRGAKCRDGEHVWEDWKVELAPTCVTEGKETRNCKICGYPDKKNSGDINYRTVPKDENAHSWIDYSEGDKVATCTENGAEGSKICERCGTIKSGEVIEKTGHSLGEWKVTKEATVSEKGIKERKCSNCDFAETEEYELETPALDEYPTENYYDGYYAPIVSWQNGEDLKNQLHTLIRTNFTGLVYEGNWETNQMAEQSLTDFTNVNVIYSQKDDKKINTYGGASAGATGWQREHAFCASLMTSYLTGEAVSIASSGSSRATDFHNLFAAYGAANGSRGNKNFGNYNPANAVTDSKAIYADTKADNKNYEPNDCDKGRLARAIFYMGVMYNEDETSRINLKYNYGGDKSTTVKVDAKYKPLRIVEDYVDFSQVTFNEFVNSTSESVQALRDTYLAKYRTDTSPLAAVAIPEAVVLADFGKAYSDYKYNEFDFAIGNLATLIDWNRKPVDRSEMWHNEVVYSYVHTSENANKGKKQGNRNPFVDYPELVDYAYGSKKDGPGELKKLCPSEYLLGTNSNSLCNYALTSYKDKYLVGETLSKADYTLVRVNKDYTTDTCDFTDANSNYTFVESDIGEKTITLTTPTGNISYVVKVESAAGANACNYKFDISKDSFTSTTVSSTPKKMISYGGVDYSISSQTSCSVAKSGDGVKFGNGTDKKPGTLTIDTVNNFSYDSKTNISSIYVGLNTASGKTYNLDIYVGEEKVIDSTFTYSNAGFKFYGGDFDSKTGPIKIVISNADAAIHLSGIYVKVN